MENWAKIFRKVCPKTCSKHVWRFWERFWAFWNFENFLVFKKIFEDSSLHGTLGIKFFKKFSPKHVQNTFGYFWERFWAFLEFSKFFLTFGKLSKIRNAVENWAKSFRKVCPKTRSKHVWIRLGTILGIFRILKKKFENFRKLDPPWNTGHKIFCKEFSPKHVQNTFGYFWEHFWAFLEF